MQEIEPDAQFEGELISGPGMGDIRTNTNKYYSTLKDL